MQAAFLICHTGQVSSIKTVVNYLPDSFTIQLFPYFCNVLLQNIGSLMEKND